MGFGIRKYLQGKRHDRRERLKERKPFEEAEIENVKTEREALNTKATLRSEKASLRKERFAGSFVGRVISGARELQAKQRTTTRAPQRSKKKSSGLRRRSRARPKQSEHKINDAFSLGSDKKKKNIFG